MMVNCINYGILVVIIVSMTMVNVNKLPLPDRNSTRSHTVMVYGFLPSQCLEFHYKHNRCVWESMETRSDDGISVSTQNEGLFGLAWYYLTIFCINTPLHLTKCAVCNHNILHAVLCLPQYNALNLTFHFQCDKSCLTDEH